MNMESSESKAVLARRTTLSQLGADRFDKICGALRQLSPNMIDPEGALLGWLKGDTSAPNMSPVSNRLTNELSELLLDAQGNPLPDTKAVCEVGVTKVASAYGFSEPLAKLQWDRAKAAASARG